MVFCCRNRLDFGAEFSIITPQSRMLKREGTHKLGLRLLKREELQAGRYFPLKLFKVRPTTYPRRYRRMGDLEDNTAAI